MRKRNHLFFFIIIFALLMLGSASCVNVSKATYFNGLRDSVFAARATEAAGIAKHDVLSIAVTSLNPEASAVFNMANLPAGSPVASANTSLGNTAGYLVNDDGDIQFPVLGLVKAEGLTKNALAAAIAQKIKEGGLLKDPVVSVRQLNFHVTVLGEVAHPAVIPVPNEKISLLEAIGMAGDLTLFAKRDNVLLVREEAGQQTVRRLNLNAAATVNSPYYHLRSGDIIYVEPNQTKINSTSQARQLVPVILSGISVVIVALSRLIH